MKVSVVKVLFAQNPSFSVDVNPVKQGNKFMFLRIQTMIKAQNETFLFHRIWNLVAMEPARIKWQFKVRKAERVYSKSFEYFKQGLMAIKPRLFCNEHQRRVIEDNIRQNNWNPSYFCYRRDHFSSQKKQLDNFNNSVFQN